LPYATTENRFSAGQGTWYAYGRVLELVAWEYLPAEVGDRMRNAFAGKYGAHSKNWPTSQFLGGNWIVTSSTTFLPTEKLQRGLLAVWADGTYGHVGFVEEVNADKKTQYRLSSFNRFGGESYQNDWYGFEGTNGALSGYYPQFYNLTKPNW
jgi:surface antigen